MVRGRPRKTETPPVEPSPTAPGVDAARHALVVAVTALKRGMTASGPLYGQVVRAVTQCMDAGLSRQAIATLIASTWAGESKDPGDVAKGIGARYVLLAKWQRGEYGRTDRALTGPVSVSGLTFRSPLDALDSGKVTFSATYNAFRAATRPERQPRAVPTDPFQAGADAVARLSITVVVDGEERRIKLSENPQALAGALQALMAMPAAVDVLSPHQRKAVTSKVIPMRPRPRRSRAA